MPLLQHNWDIIPMSMQFNIYLSNVAWHTNIYNLEAQRKFGSCVTTKNVKSLQ